MKGVEAFYTVAHVCALLQVSRDWLDERMRAGEFGTIVDLNAGGGRPEIRIPASGINEYLATHEYQPAKAVVARSKGELRRKALERARDGGRWVPREPMILHAGAMSFPDVPPALPAKEEP